MYLYFDYSALGALRWYVKVSRKGRRIGISEEYGTDAFDAAYEAAVAALGGVMRRRRIEPDPLVQPERRYVHADRSQRGQTRYYVQLRNGLPKIRIRAEFGTAEFDRQCDVAIVSQIALYGDATDHFNAQKQRNERRAAPPIGLPEAHTLRWYWTLYKQSDHWLGDLSVGHEGLSDATRLQRTGLIESLLAENGEKPFAVMTRKVIMEEMKARTPSQAGNLLSALRGMIRWMIDEGHLDEDADPTIGLRSGKAKASRESGGFLPWTEEDMALYRAKWPLGTEARLMFDILHYTFLRLGDAHRFGPPHLRQIVRKMAVQIATEKSQGNTTVTVPVHPEFAESLRAARAARIVGADVFTGKLVKGRVLPMNKKAWAMKFKKYAVLAGVNEPKKSCHGVRKARAEVAAYAECTESQMMAMFGWTDPKMPAHYIAKANREKLGISGMDKIVAFDQSQSLDDFLAVPEENDAGTESENRVVTFHSNFWKKA
ncbi:tyrosine-type recombinase/integrase [Bradyrhizobium sp. STM 3557]|uniref:tyrosine-type recombinase/integrase n=1 Tax=Bradyrhizobium sp. STM 3557 TaxID=578920 RepID=UPI00388D23C9